MGVCSRLSLGLWGCSLDWGGSLLCPAVTVFSYCLCPLFLVCRFPTFSGWQWLLGPLLPYPPLWAFRSLRPSAFVPGRLSFGCTLVGRGLLEVLYTHRAVRQPGVEGRCPAFGLISVGPRCASDSFFLWDTGILLFLSPGHSPFIAFWAMPVSHVETHFGTSAE